MLIELLMVVLVPLVELVGVPITIGICLVAVALGAWGAYHLSAVAANFLLLQEGSASGQSRYTKRELERRRAEIRADEMNDPQLREWLNSNPKDIFALDALCRRLKQAGNLEAYARERERYLDLDPDEDLERIAMHYHKLADLYSGPLARPDRARELLKRFIERHEDTKEAKLARERLTRMSGAAVL